MFDRDGFINISEMKLKSGLITLKTHNSTTTVKLQPGSVGVGSLQWLIAKYPVFTSPVLL